MPNWLQVGIGMYPFRPVSLLKCLPQELFDLLDMLPVLAAGQSVRTGRRVAGQATGVLAKPGFRLGNGTLEVTCPRQENRQEPSRRARFVIAFDRLFGSFDSIAISAG